MFREFKREFRKTRRAYEDASETGAIGFEMKYEAGTTTAQAKLPSKEKLTAYMMTVQRFLYPNDDLFYGKIWERIRKEFPVLLHEVDIVAIEEAMERLERGEIPFSYNDVSFTAREIFELISKAGYFEVDPEQEKKFQEIASVPFANQLLWYEFASFAFGFYRILSVFFDIIIRAQQHEDYKQFFTVEEPKIKKCIYCLSESNSFSSEEHVIAESLAGDNAFLDKGAVCDPCNHGICSELDDLLLTFEPIAFLRVQYGPFSKKGKAPRANLHNMILERTGPREITVTPKDKTGGFKNKEVLEDGRVKFDFSFKGNKLNWHRLGRSIFKIALGFVALDKGHEAALDSRYDAARAYILNGEGFDNGMLVSFSSKPDHRIFTRLDFRYGGTGFILSIFGMIFMVNIEAEPKLRHPDETTAQPGDEVMDQFGFKLVSLQKETSG